MQKRIAVLVFAILTLTLFASAQASPPASASCDLGGGKTIKTDYSSPRMKGRKIYGGLVPFGEVWRTGANAATTFVHQRRRRRRRKDRAGRQLYVLHSPNCRQVDAHHQQENRRVGHSLQV